MVKASDLYEAYYGQPLSKRRKGNQRKSSQRGSKRTAKTLPVQVPAAKRRKIRRQSRSPSAEQFPSDEEDSIPLASFCEIGYTNNSDPLEQKHTPSTPTDEVQAESSMSPPADFHGNGKWIETVISHISTHNDFYIFLLTIQAISHSMKPMTTMTYHLPAMRPLLTTMTIMPQSRSSLI